jgi:hypothetical protein
VIFGNEQRHEDRARDPSLGFLQLCSDRRFHLKTMEAFEDLTDLESDGYWIEARPGGAPSWADNTRMGRIAYREGAMHMGWAAHGDVCWGFRGASNEELKEKLRRTVRKRAEEFPRAKHYGLFGAGGRIEIISGQSALTSDA